MSVYDTLLDAEVPPNPSVNKGLSIPDDFWPENLSVAGNVVDLDKVDPGVLAAAKYGALAHDGKVVITSAGRHAGDKGNHSRGYALDVELYGPDGAKYINKASKGGSQHARNYEKFWQDGVALASERYPDLPQRARWGGYFLNSTPADYMHLDVTPGGQTGGGDWVSGANEAMRKRYGGQSEGIIGGDWVTHREQVKLSLNRFGRRIPQAKPESRNVYDDLLEQEQQQRVTGALETASHDQPDKAARIQQLSRASGLDAGTVRDNLDEVSRRQSLADMDIPALVRTNPILARQLEDPNFAALALDDTPTLSGLEQTLRYGANAGRAALSGVYGASEGLLGMAEAGAGAVSQYLTSPLAAAHLLPEDSGARVESGIRELRRTQTAARELFQPKADNVLESGIYSGLQSLTQNLLTLPAALMTGNPMMALAPMAGMTGGQAYGKARDKGLDTGMALSSGMLQSLIEYGTEVAPMGYLLRDLEKGAPFWKVLGHQLATDIPGEEVATLTQNMMDWAFLNPDKPAQAFLDEQPSAAAETLIATLVGAGGQVSILKAAEKLTKAGAERAQRAELERQALQQLTDLATASKTLQRDPESFEKFIEAVTEEGPVNTLYLSADALFQSGVADQLAELSPSVAEQLPNLAAGGIVAIPVSEYATKVAPSELNAALLDNLKTDPEGMSYAEAQEFVQTHSEAMQAEVARAMGEVDKADEFKASQEKVKQEVLAQLNALDRFRPVVNELYATLHASYAATRAAALGMTPEDLYRKHMLKIQAERVAGDVYNQAGVAVDFKPNTRFLQAVSDAGMVGGTVRDDGLHITHAEVSESQRGKGEGLRLYMSLINKALNDGLRVFSDATVEADAVRVYDALVRRGYTVKRLEGGTLEDGAVYGRNANEPAFEVVSRPKQSELNQTNRGAYSPSENTITLLKKADLSTFLHESAHYFFENDIAIAGELNQQASIFGMDSLSDGERRILDDVSALLRWHGIQGDIGEQLNTWASLEPDVRRSYHERTAESFELYLIEGKAPSFELQRAFQNFRAWMLNVYKSLKAFLLGHPEAGQLSDEVRQVFDRMIATTEEIQLAEYGRSMLPMFDSPEQAGWSPEEFAAYHAKGIDATNTAIDQLQAQSLRDLQWFDNARARMLAKLKRQSKELRAAARSEATTEVMRQPVYIAWAFLTRKMTDEDFVPNPARKSDPNKVDETRDNLLTAIAKLGGLNKSDVVATWGTDPAYKPVSGVFGKPVWRSKGGRSLDDMAEALGQYGYLRLDANGKVDLREFEEKFDNMLRGFDEVSVMHDYSADVKPRPGGDLENPAALGAGRLDYDSLLDFSISAEDVAILEGRRMTRKTGGLHPDIVAEITYFDSGDEMLQALLEAVPPREAINALTDQIMLERHGELATPEAIAMAADKAIHNDLRARVIAHELSALERAMKVTQKKNGRSVPLLPAAAKAFAQQIISRLKIRAIQPGQYAHAEARAAKAADKAQKAGDIEQAAAEKRNEIIQYYATKAAYDAKDEVDTGLRYLRRFGKESTRKNLTPDYLEQIDALLERYELKAMSLKGIDKRKSLKVWLEEQRAAGFEPDIPVDIEEGANRVHYRDLTVEEFRGLVEAVRQIEHLGRLKNRLLTAADKRAYQAIRDEIAKSVLEHAGNRKADTRTASGGLAEWRQLLRQFWASHIKAATWVRVMDGNQYGPLWNYLVRPANDRANWEASMRAEATQELSTILAPVFKLGKMGGKGIYFPSLDRSLNREERIAVALNVGNAGNLQRLLGGEGWTLPQIQPVLESLTATEWRAVQGIWDYFETFRPLIAAKELRVYGKEPNWIEATPFTVKAADGVSVDMRGGYYPIKYDPAASARADEHADAEAAKAQLQGANITSTTRRSFTKTRAESVKDRPLLYNFAGVYQGINEVIHDLAWHEWLIDSNRLLKSYTIDKAIRETWGPEVKTELKRWVRDIAEGERGADAPVDRMIGRLRQGISMAGLGFNVISAAMQPLGLTQSWVRIGPQWIGRGIQKYTAHPIDVTRETMAKSEFMANRTRTRFRELNELRNQVQDQSSFKEWMGRNGYRLMMWVQTTVDIPTWQGAYERAISEGEDEARAIAMADQAVKDSQGGGQQLDLSGVERGSGQNGQNPFIKLFTVFYTFMNVALNVGSMQAMTADTPAKKAKLAADFLMLYTVPAVLGYMLKQVLIPSGDDEEWDMEALARALAAEQLSYLMGLMVLVREFQGVAKIVTGAEGARFGYEGPGGLRFIGDAYKLVEQTAQGEFDDAFRKATLNIIGDITGLPSAQLNRTITGAYALSEGETDKPSAIVFGFRR